MQTQLKMTIEVEKFPIEGAFTIARGSKTEATVVSVTLRDRSGHIGRGECVPYSRYSETIDGVVTSLEGLRPAVEAGLGRILLQDKIKAGAARNALDCALWDLEAKQSGQPVAARLGLNPKAKITTAFTISLGTPEEMAKKAADCGSRPLLKIKLGGKGGDLERIRAVRAAAPNARLIADANEGWATDHLVEHFQACHENKFDLIEQPVPAAGDEVLRGIEHPVPICADESVHDRSGLGRLVGLYEFVNVKLDKTGGLTEALKLADAAEAQGFGLMIGCMVGTSLAMAPALMLAPRARFIDLDGPLLLSRDRVASLKYSATSEVSLPSPDIWG